MCSSSQSTWPNGIAEVLVYGVVGGEQWFESYKIKKRFGALRAQASALRCWTALVLDWRLFYFFIFQKHFLHKYIFNFTIYSFIPLPPGRGAAGGLPPGIRAVRTYM